MNKRGGLSFPAIVIIVLFVIAAIVPFVLYKSTVFKIDSKVDQKALNSSYSLSRLCKESDWTYKIEPASCPEYEQQIKKWSLIGRCQVGITHPSFETISCDYENLTCDSFEYSEWGECSPTETQFRTILSSSPRDCVGGNPITSQQCGYVPLCTENDWASNSTNCQIDNVQNVTWNKIGTCEGGVEHPVAETASCDYNARICNSFDYSDWSECSQSGTQSRNITYRNPRDCVGGNPITSQQCGYVPLCTENDWASNSTNCQIDNVQNVTWNKIGTCEGGVEHPVAETIDCSYNIPTCNGFVYTNWSECIQSGIRWRNVLSSYPAGCVGGSPELSQECNYAAPQCNSFTYNSWGTCSQSGTQSRNILASYPVNCGGGNPITSQQCNPNEKPAQVYAFDQNGKAYLKNVTVPVSTTGCLENQYTFIAMKTFTGYKISCLGKNLFFNPNVNALEFSQVSAFYYADSILKYHRENMGIALPKIGVYFDSFGGNEIMAHPDGPYRMTVKTLVPLGTEYVLAHEFAHMAQQKLSAFPDYVNSPMSALPEAHSRYFVAFFLNTTSAKFSSGATFNFSKKMTIPFPIQTRETCEDSTACGINQLYSIASVFWDLKEYTASQYSDPDLANKIIYQAFSYNLVAPENGDKEPITWLLTNLLKADNAVNNGADRIEIARIFMKRCPKCGITINGNKINIPTYIAKVEPGPG